MLGTREYALCSPFRANAHNSSLIYVVHIRDGTSCWTVILINDRVVSLLRIMGVPVEMYICCRPLVGRLFSWFMIYVSHGCPHTIQVFPSERW